MVGSNARPSSLKATSFRDSFRSAVRLRTAFFGGRESEVSNLQFNFEPPRYQELPRFDVAALAVAMDSGTIWRCRKLQ